MSNKWKFINRKVLYKAKWLTLLETTYETHDGQQLNWESIQRENTKTGVVVVAQLMPSKKFVLIKQYRPAIDGYVLGFPAGLSEDGDPNQGLVELKEEAGYVGEIKFISPPLKNNSGLINDSAYVIYVHIDENDPRNQNPEQELEISEDIEVFTVAPEDVKEFVETEQANGTSIGGNLWYLFVLAPQVYS